jgi:hypothetical protein
LSGFYRVEVRVLSGALEDPQWDVVSTPYRCRDLLGCLCLYGRARRTAGRRIVTTLWQGSRDGSLTVLSIWGVALRDHPVALRYQWGLRSATGWRPPTGRAPLPGSACSAGRSAGRPRRPRLLQDPLLDQPVPRPDHGRLGRPRLRKKDKQNGCFVGQSGPSYEKKSHPLKGFVTLLKQGVAGPRG